MAVRSSSSCDLCCRNSARMEPKKKMKKLRSIKLSRVPSLKPFPRRLRSSLDSQFLDFPTDDSVEHEASEFEDVSVSSWTYESSVSIPSLKSSTRRANYLKGTSSSDRRKAQIQASSHNSESSFDGNDFSRASSHCSMRSLMRKSSLRTVRVLKQKNNLKSKRALINVGGETSINRATCSSKLKGLKFQPGQRESERKSFMKVCPYHHCSINGHSHEPVPPLKQFISKRRHSLKTQKSFKSKCHSTFRRKLFTDRNEAIATTAKPFPKDEQELDVSITITSMEGCCDTNKKTESISIESKGVGASNPLSNEDNDFITEGKNADVTEASSSVLSLKSASIFDAFQKLSPDCEQKDGSCYKPESKVQSKAVLHKPNKHPLGKEKHISMWYFIHQHMVSGLATEATEQPFQKSDKENRIEDDTTTTSPHIGDLGSESADSLMGVGGQSETSNQEIERQKMCAIKLVREAFEKILLPEIQDQTLDDQSIKNDATSNQEHLEINCEENANVSFKVSDSRVLDDKSFISKEVTSTNSVEQAAQSEFRSKSCKPNSWSNLKKLLLLRRFIKALEKVKKINPRKPNQLPLTQSQESEKVSLRSQMTGERRSSEEWMLDFALQQVVSQLAPSQKKKVSLLVKAFETVVPTKEDWQGQVLFPNRKGSCNQNELDVSISEATEENQKVVKISEDLSLAISDEQFNNANVSTVKIEGCAYQVMAASKKVQQEVNKDTPQNLIPRLLTGTSGLNGRKKELGDMLERNGESSHIMGRLSRAPNVESEATRNVVSSTLKANTTNHVMSTLVSYTKSEPENASVEDFYSDQVSSLNGKPFTVCCGSCSEDMRLDVNGSKGLDELLSLHDVLQESCHASGSKTDGTILEQKTQLDKQNYIRMWHMIYQHVASGIATKVGSQLLDEVDDEEERKASNRENDSGSCHDSSEVDHDASNNNNKRKTIGFTKSDAVKLVQEAVDEILHPEVEDDLSETQSNASDILQDQEVSDNMDGDGNTSHQEEKELLQDSIAKQEDEKSTSLIVSRKPQQQKSKNWSKVKQLILLRRSIKALEKSRKLASQPRHSLSVSPEQEREKVDLNHTLLEERKKAEQWMLDYAVQNIVIKLTPARKQRVSMLVEAFEAVVPLPNF